jgi:hypothetical protein
MNLLAIFASNYTLAEMAHLTLLADFASKRVYNKINGATPEHA